MPRKPKATVDFDEPDDEPPPRGKSKIDPIIQGLFARLPASGSVWPVRDRKTWIGLMESAFNVIYEDEEPATAHIPGTPPP